MSRLRIIDARKMEKLLLKLGKEILREIELSVEEYNEYLKKL
ncbi:MAG: hypothetical protein V1854_06145 [Methanobacteriota archaeon]